MNDTPEFAAYQYEIYLAGAGGDKPDFPIASAALEAAARDALSPEAWGYVAGAAGAEDTMTANLAAFAEWRVVPRLLKDVSRRDTSIELFGARFEAPILLAPIGVQSIVNPEAELAVARAAAQVNLPFVLSTASSTAMEDVAEAAGACPRWYQLYWPNDPELTVSFIRRAEAAGYTAIVVTLDTPLLAWRPRDLQNGFLPFLKGEGVANYFSDPVFRAALDKPPEEDLQAAVFHWVQVFSDPATTWDRLSLLRENTDLPILLKGVLHPEDARRAIDLGMSGVIVSNHGGRQVDGSIATLHALPGVVSAVGDDAPVLLDSGIRTGADVVKALALGATAVLLGRPYIWGLAVGGEAGVVQVLRSVLAELDLTMALCGATSVADLDASLVVRAPA